MSQSKHDPVNRNCSNLAKLKFKAKSLVVSISGIESTTELTIIRNPGESKHDTKLSDVLKFLPAGFVHKDETGMGATTLELVSPRNSIIVEPIKITASSKAYKHGALYVGSSTRYHSNKLVTSKDIEAYVNDKSKKHKKIVVVADSLHKVISAIGEEVFKNYFLLLDEVDSFQLDSVYRKSMEECFRYYNMFRSTQRAMLSATKIDFSDPDFSEHVTFIKYDLPKPRNIDVYNVYDHKLTDAATGAIRWKINSYPEDKVFIAYNSVSKCFDIAQHLAREKILDKNEIGIFCSSSSKDKVGSFFAELQEEGLPFRVNFFTSAYFTGFDINEPYHLISVSGSRSKIHALSDTRLKQIAGRCRKELISEIILHDLHTKLNEQHSSSQLIDIAQSQIESFNCVKKHFSKHPALARIHDAFIDKMTNTLDDFGMRFTQRNNDGLLSISYLSIDAFMEGQRVQNELYHDSDALVNKLREMGNKVRSKDVSIFLDVTDNKVNRADRNEQVISIIERLQSSSDVNELYAIQREKKTTDIQKKIINDFIHLSSYFEKENLLMSMQSSLLDKNDSRKYNRLIFSATFCTYPETNHLVQRFQYHFPLRSKYTKSEILNRLNIYFTECGVPKQLDTEVKAIRFIKSLCMTYKKKGNEMYYTIKNYNPFGLHVKKQIANVEDEQYLKELSEHLFEP